MSTARALCPDTVCNAVIGATFLMLIGVPHTKVYTDSPAAIRSKTATMTTQDKTTSVPTMDRYGMPKKGGNGIAPGKAAAVANVNARGTDAVDRS